jgi:parallel beta-helix repeat protein
MAIPNNAVWEVRSSGDDANGGFFSSARSGTDYSQQNTAQLSLTDVLTNGTTTVVSATGGFTSAMVGNGINIAGTIYEIVSRTDTNTITIDRNAAAGTGQIANVGGAVATIQKAAAFAATSNTVWIKAGSYSVSADYSWTNAAGSHQHGEAHFCISGYNTTRGDIAADYSLTRPQITASGTCQYVITTGNSANGILVENLEIDCAGIAKSGIYLQGGSVIGAINCVVYGYTEYGIALPNGGGVYDCEVFDSAATGASAGIWSPLIDNCYIHDCPSGYGIGSSIAMTVLNTIVANMQSNAGLFIAHSTRIEGCIFYNTDRDGVSLYGSAASSIARNNIFAENTDYGFGLFYGNNIRCYPYTNGNAYFGNGAGPRRMMQKGTKDIDLAASPFVDAANGDFRLTDTARDILFAAGFNIPSKWLGSLGSGGGAPRGTLTGGLLG